MPSPIRPGSLAFVLLVASLMTMSAMTIDINLPAIPATAADLGAAPATLQQTVSMFFLGFAAGQLVYGSLSDRFGRKPVLIGGILLYVLSSLGCAAAGSAETLLAMRLVQGLGAGSGPVLSRAIVRDLFQGPQMARLMSFAMAAFITAPMIAPTIGTGILLVASWRWIFLFLAGYGAVLLVVTVLLVRESLDRPDPGALRLASILGAWKAVLTHPDSRLYGAIVTLVLSVLVIYLANSSAVFMLIHGFTAGQFALTFAGIAAGSALGNLLNARLVHRQPLRRLIGIGLGMCSLVLAGSMTAELLGYANPWVLLPGFFGYFLAYGLIVSNCMALALHPHGRIVGAASAALGVLQAAVPATLAGLVSAWGAAYPATPLPMLSAMLGLTLLAGLLMLLGNRQASRNG